MTMRRPNLRQQGTSSDSISRVTALYILREGNIVDSQLNRRRRKRTLDRSWAAPSHLPSLCPLFRRPSMCTVVTYIHTTGLNRVTYLPSGIVAEPKDLADRTRISMHTVQSKTRKSQHTNSLPCTVR